MTDHDLLHQFTASPSESSPAPFRQLVDRHLPLVYAAARRQLPDHMADDAAQAVFIILAKKARSLSPTTNLPAWLIRVTHNVCKDARKIAARRLQHERKAAAMSPIVTSPEAPLDYAAISPHLDAALATLSPTDRAALILRYFNSQSLAQIAAALQLSESATQKRIERALQKLRALFTRKNLTLSLATLPLALTWHAATAISPPPSLTPAITSTALAAKSASPVVLALAKSALHTLFWTPAKIVAAAATIIFFSLAIPFALTHSPPSPPAAHPSSSPLATTTLLADAAVLPTPEPTPASQPAATQTTPSAPFQATLKSGLSIQLLGIVRGYTFTSWTLPDGTPDNHPILAKARFDRTKRNVTTKDLEAQTEIPDIGLVFRILPQMHNGDTATNETEPWYCIALDAHDNPIPNVFVLHGFLRYGREYTDTITQRFDLATGPWLKTNIHPALADLGQKTADAWLSQIEPLRNGAYIALTIPTDHWEQAIGKGAHRLCACDTHNQLHIAIPFQPESSSKSPYEQDGFFFTDLPPTDIQEVWLERRPDFNEWIEFRNISLKAGLITHIEITTSDTTNP